MTSPTTNQNFLVNSNINFVSKGLTILDDKHIKESKVKKLAIKISLKKNINDNDDNFVKERILKKHDYYYISRYHDVHLKELVNQHNYTFKKIFEDEIQYLKINDFSDEQIEEKINEGKIVSTCHQLIKSGDDYDQIIDNFKESKDKCLSLIIQDRKLLFKKFQIRTLMIRMISKIGKNTFQAFPFTVKDIRDNDQHFIAYRENIQKLNVIVWSGQTDINLSTSWKICQRNKFLIQSIYNLTNKKFLVLKNVLTSRNDYLFNASELLRPQELLLRAFHPDHTDPFVLDGICSILTSVREREGLLGVILPKMKGDGVDLINELMKTKTPLFENSYKFLCEFYRMIKVLEKASEHNIYYTDFKPENIFYRMDNGLRFYLGDWDGINDYTTRWAKQYYVNGRIPGETTVCYCCFDDINSFQKFCEKLDLDSLEENHELKARLEAHVVYTIGTALFKFLKNSSNLNDNLQTDLNLNFIRELKQKWLPALINLMLYLLNKKYHERPKLSQVASMFLKIISTYKF
ncbi:MAG: hypothetical protein Q8K60_02210 [Parachlamydiaceae bacterium]|nr:hypothetical protein [Parachlamydiaceae bacterium]